MIGLDTIVVVRYVTQDDRAQAARATALIDGFTEDEPGFVSIVTLVEVDWVLRRAYNLNREAAAEVVRGFVLAREIAVEAPDLMSRALRRVRAGAGLADALVVEQSLAAGCQQVVTFDRRAARDAGMTAIGD